MLLFYSSVKNRLKWRQEPDKQVVKTKKTKNKLQVLQGRSMKSPTKVQAR